MAEMTVEQFSVRMKELVRSGDISKSLVRVADQLALAMERGAKRRTTGGNPLHVRTGKLRQSIRFATKAKAGGVTATIQAGSRLAFYASVHEYGKTITAKNTGGYLRFQIGDRFVTTRSVTIPKRPFLAPARASAVKAAPHLLHKELAETIRSGIRGD